MFGISFAELIVVMVVALLVFGPEKLPEIASQLGKLSFQLKRASDGFRREFYNSVYTPVKEHRDLLSSEVLTAKKDLVNSITEESQTKQEEPKQETGSAQSEQANDKDMEQEKK